MAYFESQARSGVTIQAFTEVCETLAAPNCNYDDSDSSKYGTDPSLEDTDGDGLTDGEELFEFSTNPGDDNYANPHDDDTDDDGWNDNREDLEGTETNNPDTDGDGAKDSVEESICAVFGCRDPNVKDQEITVEYVSLHINEDQCEFGSGGALGTGEGEWHFSFRVDFPGTDDIGLFESGDVPPVENPSVVPLDSNGTLWVGNYGDSSFTFIKANSETFYVKGFVQELDDGAADMTYEFSETYSGDVATVTKVFTNQQDCKVNVTVDIIAD